MTQLLTKNNKIKNSISMLDIEGNKESSQWVKTDKPIVFNFGIPAFMSNTGFKTCPNAKDCVKGCYAKQGAYVWSNVSQAFEWRLEETKSVAFVLDMTRTIKRKRGITHVRMHDSGDFYSKEYMLKWIKIAEQSPEVVFYGYTKQVGLAKDLKTIMPDNFVLIYSYGGREDHLIDKATDRHSKVFSTREALLADKLGYIDASKNDLIALTNNWCVGLVYHGAKSKNWGK